MDDCSYGVGLPLVAEAVIRPFPIVGFGIQAFADLNTAASFGGAAVVVHVGWMPTR